jgi:hypothetical protein
MIRVAAAAADDQRHHVIREAGRVASSALPLARPTRLSPASNGARRDIKPNERD